jgi:hypothetical protein
MGQHHEQAKGMHTDRTRDDNGELRQKRGDTLVGNIEREYDVDFHAEAICVSTHSGNRPA